MNLGSLVDLRTENLTISSLICLENGLLRLVHTRPRPQYISEAKFFTLSFSNMNILGNSLLRVVKSNNFWQGKNWGIS